MAKDVKVNLDLLDSVKAIYDDCIEQLTAANKRLENAIEQLRESEWNTEGSKEFLRLYDEEDKPELSDHISHLKHLRKCLQKASETYHTSYYNKL